MMSAIRESIYLIRRNAEGERNSNIECWLLKKDDRWGMKKRENKGGKVKKKKNGYFLYIIILSLGFFEYM